MTDTDILKDVPNDFEFKEGELDDYLAMVGMRTSFQELPTGLKSAVIESAKQLHKIDLIGRSVQRNDSEILEGSEQSSQEVNDNFKKNVKTELDTIDNEFRKNNGDWFKTSLRELVRWAGDNGSMSPVSGSNIEDESQRYARRLGQAGEYFNNMMEVTYPLLERGKMEEYMKNDRPEILKRMSSIISIDLASSVSSIPNLKQVSV